jgi:hypothetical protein
MRLIVTALAAALGLAACGYVSEYERQVYDWEPVYCYRTLGAVECHNEPDRTADKRLVNYYGPDPSRTDPPDRPEYERPDAPPAVDYWVKDPEPIPEPSKPYVRASETGAEDGAARAEPDRESAVARPGEQARLFAVETPTTTI